MSPPRVVVEPTLTGRFAVRVRPLLRHPELESTHVRAWEALERADLIGGEFGWPVVDRTGFAL